MQCDHNSCWWDEAMKWKNIRNHILSGSNIKVSLIKYAHSFFLCLKINQYLILNLSKNIFKIDIKIHTFL